jgi:hypothetical protein
VEALLLAMGKTLINLHISYANLYLINVLLLHGYAIHYTWFCNSLYDHLRFVIIIAVIGSVSEVVHLDPNGPPNTLKVINSRSNYH